MFDEQEGGRKWQMHGVLNHILYMNLWSTNVIPRSVENFNVQFLKKFGPVHAGKWIVGTWIMRI